MGVDESGEYKMLCANRRVVAYGGTGTVVATYQPFPNNVTLVTAIPGPATMALLGLAVMMLRKKCRDWH